MSMLTATPKVIRGALVSVDITSPIPQVIVFQYNPDSVTRSLQAQTVSEGGERSEATRIQGAPAETIKMDVEIDATDQMEGGGGSLGVYPQLSALEMLIYPGSARVIANTVLLATGTIEIMPPAAPVTILVWGYKRVVPVTVKDFSITEEAFDNKLNPTRAKVQLGLRVLTYDDLSLTHPGYYMFLAHQVVKETMAALNTINNVAALGAGSVKLF